MWNTVLFDLDGTLTDSGEGIMNCVAYALKKEFSIETEHPEELRVFVGPPLKEMFMEYAHLNGAEADRAVAAYRERYTAKGIFENRLYDGIAPMLSALRQQHFTLALASSKPEHFCREILRYFGIEGYFTEVVGSEMNGGRTKKADVIEEALRRLGMSEHRDEVVIVGDRSYDIDGAGQAGIASIGVTYGYGSRAELEKAWPDCIVDTPQEIVNVLIGQARAETPSGGERTAGGTRAAGEAEVSEASVPGDSGDWCCFTDPVTGRRKDARRTGVTLTGDGSVLFRIWRVIYPLLLDECVSYLIAMAAAAVIAVSRHGIGYQEAYLANGLWITGLADAVLIPVFFLLLRGDERRRRARGENFRIPIRRSFPLPRLLEVAVYSICVSETIGFFTSMIRVDDDSYRTIEQIFGSSGLAAQVLVLVIIGPVMEELLFRGLIYRRIRDCLGVGWAAVLSGICFGIAHGNLTQGVYAALFGMVLALIYEHFGTLRSSVTAHIANNAFSVFGPMFLPNMDPAASGLMLFAFMVLTAVISIHLFGENGRPNVV